MVAGTLEMGLPETGVVLIVASFLIFEFEKPLPTSYRNQDQTKARSSSWYLRRKLTGIETSTVWGNPDAQ
mgnify:CR=1 FL=1|tara:strand:- start:1042 stop:1251 length:210 start_codon:yes stop_codon:yes gene_type:complete